MNLTQKFLAFTLLGAQWVLWLLIGLSVVSVAVMIERAIFFLSRRLPFDRVANDVKRALRTNDIEATIQRYASLPAMEAVVITIGLRESRRGAAAAAEAMVSARSRQKVLAERHLAFLGTLGNNAPFVGLFGTVLGIIKAFHDLSENSAAGAQAVMSGVSEALVATAVGLMVAIPAVIAFNFFNRRVRAQVAASDALAHVILTELRAEGAPAREAA